MSIIPLSISAHWTCDSVKRSAALSRARGIAQIFVQTRQAYTDYRTEKSPHIFAKSVSADNVRIYSPYPFPVNKFGGLHGIQERAAWKHLANKKEIEYVHWESNKLKYSIPDYMTAKCVACHNKADSSPKTDWKVGDVRGIIEITVGY